MAKGNYKANDSFSSEEFGQTDFGRIYFNNPKERTEPESVEELARLLKSYNEKGIPVTIRNTGHSMNGQTLTGGVQVSVAKLTKVSFDEDKLLVRAEAGVTWDSLFKAIELPKYCTAVYPNNPGQRIKVGGTVAVGGGGLSSSKYGGVWNIVESLTLVTMQGEIIRCSREENPELFSYSLGGFGRIGVIAEVILRVQKSSEKLLGLLLLYHNQDTYFSDVGKAMKDDSLESVVCEHPLAGRSMLSKFGVKLNSLLLISEVENEKEAFSKAEEIRSIYKEDFLGYIESYPDSMHTIDISLRQRVFLRKDIAYWFPKTFKENQLNQHHPWSDYIIDRKKFPEFLNEATEMVISSGVDKYMQQYSIFDKFLDLETYGSYTVRKIEPDTKKYYPLTFDLPDCDDYSLALSIFPTVPTEEIDRAEALVNSLTELCYKYGGKRYLYALHNLSPEQIKLQYGEDVIAKWQELKKKLDPKNLLNLGVIENLD